MANRGEQGILGFISRLKLLGRLGCLQQVELLRQSSPTRLLRIRAAGGLGLKSGRRPDLRPEPFRWCRSATRGRADCRVVSRRCGAQASLRHRRPSGIQSGMSSVSSNKAIRALGHRFFDHPNHHRHQLVRRHLDGLGEKAQPDPAEGRLLAWLSSERPPDPYEDRTYGRCHQKDDQVDDQRRRGYVQRVVGRDGEEVVCEEGDHRSQKPNGDARVGRDREYNNRVGSVIAPVAYSRMGIMSSVTTAIARRAEARNATEEVHRRAALARSSSGSGWGAESSSIAVLKGTARAAARIRLSMA